MQDEHNKLLFFSFDKKTNPILPKHVAECANGEFCFIFKGQCHLQLMHINVYVNIFYIYLYTYSTYTHTRTPTHTHTHGWCRPLQSHGAINSQIYKINRFSSNRSLLDVEITHENKTDQNPDPAGRTWAWGQLGADPSILQTPAGGWQSPLETFLFLVFGCSNFLQMIPSLSCYKHLESAWERRCWIQGEISLPSSANAHLTEAIPREGGGGGHQIKAAFSNTGWSTKRFFFFYQKGSVSLFFFFASEAHITFLKANFRTNGESSHKIWWVYANSNLKNANSALIVWSQPQRPAPQALSSSKQLTS